MFEETTHYQAAYIGEFPTFEENFGFALSWASDMATQHTSGITAVVPTKRHVRNLGPLASLPGLVEVETPRTLARLMRTESVVVSLWPLATDLEQLDRARDLKALVAIPWLEKEIDTWRRARGAIDLTGQHPIPDRPSIGDPVVESALRSLTGMVNLSTGVGNPRDRSMAIHAFKILKRNGHGVHSDEVGAWAMAHGWAADDARELSELSEGVLAGKAYRAGRSGWNQRIIHIWRQEAT